MAKQVQTTSQINGLETNPSFLSIKDGATVIADNVTVNRDGMAESRRGFREHSAHTSKIVALAEYRANLLIFEADGTVSRNDTVSAGATAYATTIQAPAGTIPRTIDARGTLYATSNTGIRKIDAPDGAWMAAGLPPGIDLAATVTGTTGFLAASSACSYRVVFTVTDANGIITRSAPSPIAKVTNTSTTSAADVTVTFSVPRTLPTGAKYELYRSEAVPAAQVPADSMYLVKSGTVSGSSVTVTDNVLDDYLLTPLYTNAEEEGILQGNWLLPMAKDIEAFKDYTYLANTVTNWSKTIKLISATGGIVDDTSTITISDGASSRTYTFSTSENFALNKFQRYTGGTPAQNIEATAKSLCRAINRDAYGKWFAVYMSSEVDDPGIIDIYTDGVAAGQFSITSNIGAVFDPELPGSGATVAATRDEKANRVYYSKPQQPEHFPLVNYLDVGRNDKAISGIRALKDSLFIIKEDGVWYLANGVPSSATLVTLDSTTFCVAPKSIVKLNNDIYFLSNQGVVRINENGAAVISADIENLVTDLLKRPNVDISHAVGFERDRQYVLWVPSTDNETIPSQAYVFNIFKNKWTRWTKPATTAATVNNKLFIGSGWDNKVLRQRDTRTAYDYSDEEISVTITDVIGNELVMEYAYPYARLAPGFSVHQGTLIGKVRSVSAVSPGTFSVVIDQNTAFTPGPATVRIPIPVHVRLHPSTQGLPGVTKSYQDFTFILDGNTVSQVTLESFGNEAGTLTETTIFRTPDGTFGKTPFGKTPWGDGASYKSVPLRENFANRDSNAEFITIGIKHKVSTERFGVLAAQITYQVSTDVTAAGGGS